jgi:hypothetical protein
MNQISTGLHANPFCILGVTPRDDRRKIVESAEERALQLDGNLCSKARSDLTNPRTRLSCEMAWMPGVAPATVEKVLRMLADSPQAVLAEPGLTSLALANLMSAACERVPMEEPIASVARFMSDFADLVDSIDPEAVLRDVNADRVIAGFPEVRGMELVAEELTERRRAYRLALKNLLDTMYPEKLIATMTEVVRQGTNGGDKPGTTLIEDLVDSYEVEAQGFLHRERENITSLIKSALETAPRGEIAVIPIMARLETIARKWVEVAQPIQICARSRGFVHTVSREVANDLRNLGIELNNKHGMPNQVRRMTELLQEIFAQLPELAERLEEDAEAIAGFGEQTEQHNVNFRANLGGKIFKREFEISAEGLHWRRRTFPLDSITRIRWGGTRQIVLGVQTDANYVIGFGDNRTEQIIELSNTALCDVFIERLWRAVCVRLISDVISALEQGTSFHIGNIKVADDSVTLVRRRSLRLNDLVRLGWNEVHVWRNDGHFMIGQQNNKNVSGSASYLRTWNTHVLEHIIRGALTKGSLKLSDSVKV